MKFPSLPTKFSSFKKQKAVFLFFFLFFFPIYNILRNIFRPNNPEVLKRNFLGSKGKDTELCRRQHQPRIVPSTPCGGRQREIGSKGLARKEIARGIRDGEREREGDGEMEREGDKRRQGKKKKKRCVSALSA